jgi:hypothetical protein
MWTSKQKGVIHEAKLQVTILIIKRVIIIDATENKND